MNDSFQEKRKYPRLSAYVGINYRASSAEKTFDTHTANISAGGIRLILLQNFPVNAVLEIKFLLPNFESVIKAKARVVWNKELTLPDPSKPKVYDAGLEFVEISEKDQEIIKNYVAEHV